MDGNRLYSTLNYSSPDSIVVAVRSKSVYTHNTGKHSDLSFQFLWMDLENQKHDIAFQSMRTSQVSIIDATLLCLVQSNIFRSMNAPSFQSCQQLLICISTTKILSPPSTSNPSRSRATPPAPFLIVFGRTKKEFLLFVGCPI